MFGQLALQKMPNDDKGRTISLKRQHGLGAVSVGAPASLTIPRLVHF